MLEMDRALSRVLSLPIFDDEFTEALRTLSLDRIEKFIVLEVDSGTKFLELIVRLFENSHSEAVQALVDRTYACSALIEILNNSKTVFLKSAVDELGFAQSQSSTRGRKDCGLAKDMSSVKLGII